MRWVTVLWRLLPAAVLLAAAGTWVLVDYRTHRDGLIEDHRLHAGALLDAFEGTALRESRGGYYQPEEFSASLSELSRGFGVSWVAVKTADGPVIVEVGTKPDVLDPLLTFEKRFEPLLPRGRGFGLRGREEMTRIPAGPLTLSLAMPGAPLAGKLAQDRRRAIITATIIGLMFLLLAGLSWFRARSLGLQSALKIERAQRQGLEFLRRLGAGLVHETRNPLGVIRGFAERIVREPLEGASLKKSAQAILEETDRTTARLDEFLLLSRPAELRRELFELRPLLEELVRLLDADLKSSRVALRIECGPCSLHADREQLRRLFMNLLLNAVRASVESGAIAVSCVQIGGGLRIVVADEGAGVPEEIRETLFEPYVSGQKEGTGLGLSIARRIALDHGFLLRYEPNVPRGTRMIVEVPAP
ncbi:MAG: HAMP domain-containing sensor histidine kinase [Planctomycetota bacterium]